MLRVPHGIRRPGRAAVCCLALAGAAALTGVSVRPAAAQFQFFGQGEASPQDVYNSVASHGFRLLGPLMRNGNVYVADVLDRQRRRERLVISADSAEIIQRFFVDLGGAGRRQTYGAPLPGGPAGNALPPQQPMARADTDGDFFSRLARGWGDDSMPPRPPLGLDGSPAPSAGDDAVMPRALPRPRPRPRVEPRVVTRTEDAPVTSSPLPAPSPVTPEPSTTASPAPSSRVNPSRGPTSVSTDPLRIPGTKDTEAAKQPEVAATVPTNVKPVSIPTAPAVPKPAPATPTADVPVAPLD